MKLSILIPTLEQRAAMLANVLFDLNTQIDYEEVGDQVEIVVLCDGGEKPTGAKRNELLEQAKGEYISFVDDDDVVSPNYIHLVLDALKTSPDVVGMRGVYCVDGRYFGLFEHSIEHKEWYQTGDRFFRPPNHLNPVKREFALLAKFPDVVFGEDREYSMKLRLMLSTQVMIDTPIYTYMARQK